MTFLSAWAETTGSNWPELAGSEISAIGSVDRHAGAMILRASARATVSPSRDFYVKISQKLTEEQSRAAEFFAFGVLDILVSDFRGPSVHVSICVTEMIWDEVYSSNLAFRVAGRSAGEVCLAKLKAAAAK